MSDPLDVVKALLDAIGRRDLDAASALLAPDFKMTVSGGHVFGSLQEFVAFSRGRQQGSKKTTNRYDVIPTASGAVIYAIGSMAGTWNDGSTFSGVRYIDRFEVAGGKVVDMNVWSDMAEFRPVED